MPAQSLVVSEQQVNTRFAYMGVVLIWSSTPLAINWSSLGGGPLFGLAARMLIGAVIALLTIQLLRREFPLHRQAIKTYLVGGIPLYGAMTSVYLSSQVIPSGWIAIIFGLTPVLTGIMAAFWLNERAFTLFKTLGMALAFAGLVVIFNTGMQAEEGALIGVMGVLLSAVIHSFSAVWIKRINAGLGGLTVTVGSLWVALPLFIATWLLFGQPLPDSLPDKAIGGILYLGIVGSVLGFSLYYFILKHLEASKVALITLITPVGGLWVGHTFNDEAVTMDVVIGTSFIVLGLAIYDFLPKLIRKKGVP